MPRTKKNPVIEFKTIKIPLSDERIQLHDGSDGDFVDVSYTDLQNLIDKVKASGFSEKDYKNIRIDSTCYARSNDTYIFAEIQVEKSQKEIDEELKVLKDQEILAQQRKLDRQKVKEEKEKILAGLTKEQKKALKIKV